MRDDHYQNHVATDTQEIPHAKNPEADEIQPLLFDLVKADKVDVVRNLLDQFHALPLDIRKALRDCAASFGSIAMVDLIEPFDKYNFPKNLMEIFIQTGNIDLFKHLLLRSEGCSDIWASFSIVC
jgi:hypothetical protein